MPSWKRVRTGCWTCRRRGYRCDETKPACQTCIRLAIPCEGYGVRLKWLPPSSKSSRSLDSSAVRSSVQAVHTPRSETSVNDTKIHSPALPPTSPQPSLPSALSNDQHFLLRHFFYTVSGLLSSTHDTSINTYCRVIIPMGLSCDLLLDAILSVSATHLATRYDSFHLCAMMYRDRVLKGLINSIRTQTGFDVTMLATIIMLSIHEVFEADAYSWVKHLRAAGAFIRNYMQKCKAPDTATRMLFDIFLYHNALALISTKQSELFMDIYTDNKWCALQGQRTAFLASVDTLLSLVARLSIFATQSDTYSSDDERNLHLSAIRRELQLWFPPEGICDDARHTAEAMRHAALLYHYQIASTDDASKAITRSYRAIIRHIGQVSVSSPSVASHVWPLYMAGTTCQEVTGGDDRTFIRDRLSQMRAFRSIKSIDRVRETLEQRWADPRVGSNAEAPLILF